MLSLGKHSTVNHRDIKLKNGGKVHYLLSIVLQQKYNGYINSTQKARENNLQKFKSEIYIQAAIS